MRFDQKLDLLTQERRMTNQRELAALIGVSKSKLNRWFSGESKPDIQEGLKLARILEVSLDYLADDEMDAPSEGLTAIQKEVLQLAERVTYEVALDRMAVAPESKAPKGRSYQEQRNNPGPPNGNG